MRAVRAIALGALLLIGSATVTFADDAGGMSIPTRPGTERYNDDAGGMSVPTVPSDEREYDRWA